jgi:hypothetical protein
MLLALQLLLFASCEKRAEAPTAPTAAVAQPAAPSPLASVAPDASTAAPAKVLAPKAPSSRNAPSSPAAAAPTAAPSSSPAPAPSAASAAVEPVSSPQPAAAPKAANAQPFSTEAERSSFEEALLAGDLSKAPSVVDASDQAAAIEAWASAVDRAKGLDAAIARLAPEAEKPESPPQVAFALAALYGRKGLISKQYAALAKSEEAAKARPDVVFAIAAVYGRKDTLKSKYSSDELLVGSFRVESDPTGAKVVVDGAERGNAPLAIDKLKDGRHKLRLESEGYDPWEAPFDIDTGRETRLDVKLGAKPGSLEVALTPALSVRLDDSAYEDSPHLFEGVTPGDHLLNFSNLFERRFYTVDDDLPVLVSPAQKVALKRTFQVARSRLLLPDMPKGSALYIDDARRSDADAKAAIEGEGLEVEAGIYDVKAASPSGQAWYRKDLSLYSKGRLACKRMDMALIMARRTIKLDGKTDSWGSIEPLAEIVDASFMGDPACAIKAVYICRDDRYLYWRVDFNGKNPLLHPPKGTGQYIQSGIYMPIAGGNIDLSVSSDRSDSGYKTWCGIYYQKTGFQNFSNENPIAVKYSENMYVARLPLIIMGKHFDALLQPYASVANVKNGNWAETMNTRGIRVDFTK